MEVIILGQQKGYKNQCHSTGPRLTYLAKFDTSILTPLYTLCLEKASKKWHYICNHNYRKFQSIFISFALL